jgi:hypothetical protein
MMTKAPLVGGAVGPDEPLAGGYLSLAVSLRCHEQLEVVQGGHRLEGSLAVIVHLEGADVMRAG